MKRLLQLLFLILLTFLIASCAAFKSSKKINLAPFAENAVSIVSEIQYGLSEGRAIHTRPFIDGPAVENYRETWRKLGRFLRGIVAYSVQVVTISQSDMKDNEKANYLADYLVALGESVFQQKEMGFELTPEEFNNAIKNIRAAETYVNAISGAHPLIEEVARVARLIIEDLQVAQQDARIEVADKIAAYHAPVLSFRDDVKKAQTRTFHTMTLISAYKMGDESAIDSIFSLDPQLKDYYDPKKGFTLEAQDKIEKRMILRIQLIASVKEQIYPELEQYQKEMRELDDLIAIADRGIRQSKGAIGVWRQSHSVMAAGITEPAAIDLFGIAKAAIRKVAPIP